MCPAYCSAITGLPWHAIPCHSNASGYSGGRRLQVGPPDATGETSQRSRIRITFK
jgi:hypothetical protein